MSGFKVGDRVRITIDHIEGLNPNRFTLDNAEGVVMEYDGCAAVKVRLTSGADTDNDTDWWFSSHVVELIVYPTDEEVEEVIKRTVELERSLRGAITAHAERESRQG